jgi:hypothetical protein
MARPGFRVTLSNLVGSEGHQPSHSIDQSYTVNLPCGGNSALESNSYHRHR